jgi:hypothetical protein
VKIPAVEGCPFLAALTRIPIFRSCTMTSSSGSTVFESASDVLQSSFFYEPRSGKSGCCAPVRKNWEKRSSGAFREAKCGGLGPDEPQPAQKLAETPLRTTASSFMFDIYRGRQCPRGSILVPRRRHRLRKEEWRATSGQRGGSGGAGSGTSSLTPLPPLATARQALGDGQYSRPALGSGNLTRPLYGGAWS